MISIQHTWSIKAGARTRHTGRDAHSDTSDYDEKFIGSKAEGDAFVEHKEINIFLNETRASGEATSIMNIEC